MWWCAIHDLQSTCALLTSYLWEAPGPWHLLAATSLCARSSPCNSTPAPSIWSGVKLTSLEVSFPNLMILWCYEESISALCIQSLESALASRCVWCPPWPFNVVSGGRGHTGGWPTKCRFMHITLMSGDGLAAPSVKLCTLKSLKSCVSGTSVLDREVTWKQEAALLLLVFPEHLYDVVIPPANCIRGEEYQQTP